MNIDLLFLIHLLVGLQQGNDHCCLVVVPAEESEDIRDVNVPPYLYIYIFIYLRMFYEGMSRPYESGTEIGKLWS